MPGRPATIGERPAWDPCAHPPLQAVADERSKGLAVPAGIGLHAVEQVQRHLEGNRAVVLRPGAANGAARRFGGHAYTPPLSPRGLPDIPGYGVLPWRASIAYVSTTVLTRLQSPGGG